MLEKSPTRRKLQSRQRPQKTNYELYCNLNDIMLLPSRQTTGLQIHRNWTGIVGIKELPYICVSHNGEKPYSCQQCYICFHDAETLVRHMVISRLVRGTKAVDVSRHIESETGLKVTCDPMVTKYDSYCSFFVCLPQKDHHHLLVADMWPKGSIVRPYYE